MSEKYDLEQNDSLRDYYKEIGDGMEPPAHLVQAAKTGVFANPAAKPSIHVWRFTKAVACYALGIALFLGCIGLLPRLFEGFGPAGPQVTTTTTTAELVVPDPVPHHQALSAELEAEIDAAYQKKYGRSLEFDEIGEHQVWYLGTYNGSIVLYKWCSGIFLAVTEVEEIAGYEFVFGPGIILCAYKEGEIQTIADAYEAGWLRKEDVGKIAACYQKVLRIDANEELKEEILKAYAGDRTDIDQISVRIIAQKGDLCAVWIDDPSANYLDVIVKYTVFGLTFDYSSSHQILIYKRGIDYFYTIREAAHYDKILSKEFVREIYIAYYSASLKLKEKRYCTATVDDDFSENQIFIAVHSEFNEYPYTEQDFDFIGCTKVEEIAAVGDIGPNGEASQYRLLLLTLNQSSKQNVLSAVKRLEAELDIHTAGPYGYEKMPDLPETPVVPPQHSSIEEEIAYAYADRYGKDISKLTVRIAARDPRVEQKYYAVFVDDADAVYENKAMEETVDGWIFRYSTTQTLLVYSNGAFYTLAEAFNNDLFTRYQLSDLNSQYQKKYPHLYEASYLQSLAEAEIKQLCPKRYGIGRADDYSVRFVMTVGKGYIIYIDGPISVTDKATTQTICGLDFVYPTTQVMEFYKDGKFYSLPEAFEQGILHRMTIHWLYSSHNPELTEEIIRAHIASDECDKAASNHKVRMVAKMDDRYAVFIDCPGVMYAQEEIVVTINGLDFWYSDYHQMEIYCDGKMYSVQSAFEKGILSENQLRYLYEIHRGNYDYPYAP